MTDEHSVDDLMRDPLQGVVTVKEGHIVINVSYEYNIELARVRTAAHILAWVQHLGEKTWMTIPVLRRFIYVACREANVELPNP